jgi:diguanylate cyclase (GGDEF)-like protein
MAAETGGGRNKNLRNNAIGVGAAIVILVIDLVVSATAHLGLLVPVAYFGLLLFLYRAELDQSLLITGIAAGVLTLIGGVGTLSSFDATLILDRVVYAATLVALSTILFAAIRQQRELRSLSTVDALTGALHEQAFIAQVSRETIRVRRYRTKLSIIMAEIDNFAQIRKLRGAAASDALLATLAKVCLTGIRPTDLFGRSGNRLLIAMPETTELGSSTVAERLRSALSDPALLPESVENFDATVSYGISWVSDRDTNAENVLTRAEKALHAAQAKGPGSISTLKDSVAAA